MKWMLIAITLVFSSVAPAALNCEIAASRAAIARVAEMGTEQPVSVTVTALSQVNISTRVLESGVELKGGQYQATVVLKSATATTTVDVRLYSSGDAEKCEIEEVLVTKVN